MSDTFICISFSNLLTSLAVPSNNIGAAGLIGLAKAVQHSHIDTLYVWNNPGLAGPTLNHDACKVSWLCCGDLVL